MGNKVNPKKAENPLSTRIFFDLYAYKAPSGQNRDCIQQKREKIQKVLQKN